MKLDPTQADVIRKMRDDWTMSTDIGGAVELYKEHRSVAVYPNTKWSLVERGLVQTGGTGRNDLTELGRTVEID